MHAQRARNTHICGTLLGGDVIDTRAVKGTRATVLWAEAAAGHLVLVCHAITTNATLPHGPRQIGIANTSKEPTRDPLSLPSTYTQHNMR